MALLWCALRGSLTLLHPAAWIFHSISYVTPKQSKLRDWCAMLLGFSVFVSHLNTRKSEDCNLNFYRDKVEERKLPYLPAAANQNWSSLDEKKKADRVHGHLTMTFSGPLTDGLVDVTDGHFPHIVLMMVTWEVFREQFDWTGVGGVSWRRNVRLPRTTAQ